MPHSQPAAEDESGFVSVALVADVDATCDLIEQVDEHIEQLHETLDDDDYAAWRRLSHRC